MMDQIIAWLAMMGMVFAAIMVYVGVEVSYKRRFPKIKLLEVIAAGEDGQGTATFIHDHTYMSVEIPTSMSLRVGDMAKVKIGSVGILEIIHPRDYYR